MAFAVNLLRDQEGQPMAGEKKAEQRIYRTVDGELVRENDPRGAFLAYPVGEPIKQSEVGAYERLIAGDAGEHEVPGLMHDRLATAIADAQRVLANNPSEAAAAAAVETLDEAVKLVDAERIPQPAPRVPASPAAIVRDHAAGDGDGDRVLADAEADGQGEEKPAAKSTSRAGTKAAAKPADKAAASPGDK